jgi:hypothetical protein
MATLNFELPDILWKVTKTYSTNGVSDEHLKIIENSAESFFFQDVNLAQEFYYQFGYDYVEFVSVDLTDEGPIGYELNVIPKIERIETITLIPEIVDL